MPPHPLTNLKILRYYQNNYQLNGVYSRNNLPKVKDRTYGINLDEFDDIVTQWDAIYVSNNNKVTYFDSFGVIYYNQYL